MARIRIVLDVDECSTRIEMAEIDDGGRAATGEGAARGNAYMPTEHKVDTAVGAIVAGMWERARRRLGVLQRARDAAERVAADRTGRCNEAGPPGLCDLVPGHAGAHARGQFNGGDVVSWDRRPTDVR